MSERPDRLELIARLKDNPGVRAAHEEVVALKREYEANLGKTLMRGGNTQAFSQREIDYQRGYWQGMLFAFARLIPEAGPKLNKLLEKELEERDSQ